MATYDLGTTVGKIRLLIGDTDITDAYLSDEEITALYSMAGSVYGAAALALRRIATDKALTAKAIKAGNYSEDPSKFIERLFVTADKYESKDEAEPAEGSAEVIYDQFGYDNVLFNRALREEYN